MHHIPLTQLPHLIKYASNVERIKQKLIASYPVLGADSQALEDVMRYISREFTSTEFYEEIVDTIAWMQHPDISPEVFQQLALACTDAYLFPLTEVVRHCDRGIRVVAHYDTVDSHLSYNILGKSVIEAQHCYSTGIDTLIIFETSTHLLLPPSKTD